MNADELRAMTYEELTQHVEELQQELFNLRFRMSTRQLDDTSRVRQVRRDVARAKGIMRELELKAEV